MTKIFLTPYGTLFRYDILDEGVTFDRTAARNLVAELHRWVETQLKS